MSTSRSAPTTNETAPLGFDEFRTQPAGAVVGAVDETGEVWAPAFRYPTGWKVAGYIGVRSDTDAWNILEGDDGSTVVQLYVDESLVTCPPSEVAAIVAGDPDRAERIRRRTAELAVGWYVTTGLWHHHDPMVIDGPLATLDAARAVRAAIEQQTAGPTLYLDVVEAVPGAT